MKTKTLDVKSITVSYFPVEEITDMLEKVKKEVSPFLKELPRFINQVEVQIKGTSPQMEAWANVSIKLYIFDTSRNEYISEKSINCRWSYKRKISRDLFLNDIDSFEGVESYCKKLA